MNPRTVVWFSCGAASAVAAHLTLKDTPDAQVVYCDTSASEHPDNERFFRDVETWLGVTIHRIRSSSFSDIDDVFVRTRYMAGVSGARCTVEMKKVPRFAFQRPDDIHVFGLTADEKLRIERFARTNFDLSLRWVLRDVGMDKDACFHVLRAAGIPLPAMYALGYRNNNCIGCVKATSAVYWDKIRTDFPVVFARRAQQSRDLGVRLTRVKGQRIFLDELPAGPFRGRQENVTCGPECGNARP